MLGKIAYNAIATAVNVASGLVRNKIFAAFLSLNLFGVLSLGQQSVSLVVTVFAFGLPLGITTLVSQIVAKSHDEQAQVVSRVVALAMLVSGTLTVLLAAVVIIKLELLSQAVTATDAYAVPIALLLFSAPLMLLQTCLYAVMEGMGKVREIVRFKIIPALVTLPILYFVTAEFHLTGAAIGLLISEALLVVSGMFLLRHDIRFKEAFAGLKPIVVNVYKVAVLSFGVGAFWFLSDFVVKRYVLTSLGEVENGIVQSVAKIADLYPTIALSWLSMHLFPLIGLNREDKRSTTNALQRTALVAVVLIVPIIIILFTFRAQILQLVYKEDFVVGAGYFGAMLTIGILKVFSWVLGIALLPLGLRKEWFYSGILMTVLYTAGVWVGIESGAGIYAIPIALGIGLFAQVAYTLIVFARNNLVFDKSISVQMAAYGGMTILLVLAVFNPLLLIAVLFVFVWFVVHYDLLTELRSRLTDVKSKFFA